MIRLTTCMRGQGSGLDRIRMAAFALVLLAGLPALSQQPGTIADRVVTAADPQQSYALYLPSSYTPSKRWPVIFAFDPAARGRAPVELFRAAAESRGYIVAGSNNSRNGPGRPQMAAAAAMLGDVERRFSVDPQRLYAAGFSGAARVAGMAGFICDGCIRAVIACGAGLPGGLKSEQQAQLPPYLFIVGKDDFNYFEVMDAARGMQTARRVVIFDGAHQWPPPEVAAQAVEWIESGAKSDSVPPPTPEEGKERRRQAELTRHLEELLSAAAQPSEERLQTFADARGEMADLRSKREKARAGDSTVFHRALGLVFVEAYEFGQRFEQENQPDVAAGFYEVAAEAAPTNQDLAYQVASLWAAAGDKKKSLTALRRAVGLGFRDTGVLAADRHFDGMRHSAEFQAIVSSMR